MYFFKCISVLMGHWGPGVIDWVDVTEFIVGRPLNNLILNSYIASSLLHIALLNNPYIFQTK